MTPFRIQWWSLSVPVRCRFLVPFLACLVPVCVANDLEPDLGRLERRVELAREKAAAPFSFLTDAKKAEQLRELFGEQEELLRTAWQWLDDHEAYPIPEKARTGWVPGSDIQPGHDEMEARVSRCVVKNNEIIRRLAGMLKIRAEPAGERRPTTTALKPPVPKVYQYGTLTMDAGVARLLGSFAERFEEFETAAAALEAATPEKPRRRTNRLDLEEPQAAPGDVPSRAFLTALGALSREDIETARSASRDLEGLERKLFWYLAAAWAMDWNGRNPNGHTRREVAAVRALNGYRIALGLAPLVHHPLTHELARDHSEQMSLVGFLGHVHPTDPSRRTVMDRAERIGYEDVLGENCSSTSGGEMNIWRWRSDGGHHRAMIQERATTIGFSIAGRGVLNTGSGRDLPPAALFKGLKLR